MQNVLKVKGKNHCMNVIKVSKVHKNNTGKV